MTTQQMEAQALMKERHHLNSPYGLKALVIGTVLPGVATLVVGLRLALRYSERIGIGWDDITIVITLLMIWAVTGCLATMWHNGLGYHVLEVPPANLIKNLQSLYAFELFYIADFGCCKVSILLFYLRVFSVNQRSRRIIWGLIAFMIVFTVVFEIIFLLQCNPLHYFWSRIMDPMGKLGTCINPIVLYAIYTGINILTDLIIWLYPLPILLKLQVSMGQKLGLIVVFVGGALVCIISIIRATTIPKIVAKDFTYVNVDAATWALIECPACCIVACLPTLRVLFTRRKRRSTKGYSDRPSKLKNSSGHSSEKSAGSRFKTKGISFTKTFEVSSADPEDGVPLSPYTGGVERAYHPRDVGRAH